MNTFLRQLGIQYPIIQAPMAGISTPAMAAAVSNAGGLGSIGVGNVDAEEARRMIDAVRENTDRPFNVNLFCHAPAVANESVESAWLETLGPLFRQFDATPPPRLREIYKSFLVDGEMLEMLVDTRPRVVSFHFGLPTPEAIRALKQAGITLLASATNLAEALIIQEAGIDFMVAQGIEAGGHRGAFDTRVDDEGLKTMALVRLLTRNQSIPVIATGGIMNGAGIAAALQAGANAAQLGTAFLLCPESAADAGYRRALLSDAAKSTVMTQVISGRAARTLSNCFTELEKGLGTYQVPDYPIAYDAAKSLHMVAVSQGEYGYGAQWAGEGAPLIRAMPAAELVATLARETTAAMTKE